jgi:hypothetical protein
VTALPLPGTIGIALRTCLSAATRMKCSGLSSVKAYGSRRCRACGRRRGGTESLGAMIRGYGEVQHAHSALAQEA